MGTIDSRRHLYLIGFSMGGKSSVGRRVARQLGMPFVDTDALVEASSGMSVEALFRAHGEAAFRDRESAALAGLASEPPSVVATGGGIVLRRQNRELMRRTGWLICLQAHPETIIARAEASAARRGGRTGRPLLAGPDPAQRIRELIASRRAYYAIADWTIQTDGLRLEEVARRVTSAWRHLQTLGNVPGLPDTLPDPPGGGPADDGEWAARVEAPGGTYAIHVGSGLLDEVGTRMAALGLEGKAFVIGDSTVSRLYGDRALRGLERAGFTAYRIEFPPGEDQKTLSTLSSVYDALLACGVERRDTIVALGGGVSGDLAGYAAATILRGINLIQVPTSTLAMADSSIGGKTGIDHPRAKNMIGAFWQPRAVFCDVDLLGSLPERHYRAGLAEIVKHGLILDPALVEALEASVDALQRRDAATLTTIIGWSARIKAGVVSTDEREAGLRSLLNYGHTVGHALEVVHDYRRLLHGEAIAIGMNVAAHLSARLCGLPRAAIARQNALLAAFGLPTAVPPSDLRTLASAMALDKKSAGGQIRWVLLEDIGRAVTRSDVPPELVHKAVQTCSAVAA